MARALKKLSQPKSQLKNRRNNGPDSAFDQKLYTRNAESKYGQKSIFLVWRYTTALWCRQLSSPVCRHWPGPGIQHEFVSVPLQDNLSEQRGRTDVCSKICDVLMEECVIKIQTGRSVCRGRASTAGIHCSRYSYT